MPQILTGPESNCFNVSGKFNAKLKTEDYCADQDIYVLKKLTQSLLGWPAICALHVLANINPIFESAESVKSLFPEVFSDLGKLSEPYTIKLKPKTKSFCLGTPRRIPLPLEKAVKLELKSMEEQGVISKVNEPTDWCSGMVVVPKSNGKVRICVDFMKLNESVCRELHMLPTVDETLSKLLEAKVFLNLDANFGFWQIPLAEESKHLTTFITPVGRFCFN